MAIDDECLEALYELCADYGLPIIFYTDRQMLTDEVGLPRLEDVLASYPEVDFVAHAHGWWAHISADVESEDRGGLSEGSIESPGRTPELLVAYDNIYGDLSTLVAWNALTRDEDYGREFLESHHDQLVFGSDYLFPGHKVPQLDLFDRFDLEATYIDSVSGRLVRSWGSKDVLLGAANVAIGVADAGKNTRSNTVLTIPRSRSGL